MTDGDRPDEDGQAAETPSDGGIQFPSGLNDSYLEAARQKAPFIGELRRRWYDLPFLALDAALRSWPQRLMPQSVRRRLGQWRRELTRFNDHDRNKAWDPADPMHNVTVPGDEHVTVPAIWVVELFPPSATPDLATLYETFPPMMVTFGGGSVADYLADTRGGSGHWSRLQEVDRYRRPDFASGVELISMQIGTGLTAVVGRFRLTVAAATQLDNEWHRQHEPELRRTDHGRVADSREFAFYNQTQRARRQLHDEARRWMGINCGGFFHNLGTPQPLIDVLLLELHDPTQERGEDRILRGLGLSEVYAVIESDQVPKLVLARSGRQQTDNILSKNTWALWGNRTAAGAVTDMHYGGTPGSADAVAYRAADQMENLILAMAVDHMVDALRGRYTSARDTAGQHNAFSPKQLSDLRQDMLSLSLDLSTTAREMREWWDSPNVAVPQFTFRFLDEDEERFDFTERLRDSQLRSLEDLVAAESALREILTTVATLGAARAAHRTGRIALGVSGLSLTTTLLLSRPGMDSVIAVVVRWLVER
ncbi:MULTISPECIES: hypothetical protein [Gordonia]|uniref:hypothetical protein n=1 Tax=Gordonia TaxID=2053 RepID=UPI0007EBD1B2|nr:MULTISPECIES: hypothetical protein [Gordonia]OBC06983.1 hypothetical protein A5785_08995 [Gordonia sp. 852002-50395_SCH5434458]OBC17867.1 hypothetical protein A5786_17925 [Gordonia sp. 852002-50816_SCH5313054-a]OBC18265.1 hypothetical protein A5788_10690 [Gordonia sp. 852002-50816_SCH5313054-c]SKX69995.1 Uncharacterised protein [Mycobacteroides abscessus subsp. abscessus]